MAFNVNRNIRSGDYFKITRPDGTVVNIKIESVNNITTASDGIGRSTTFTLNPNSHDVRYELDWHNCYSFGNGVESNRIRDVFNNTFLRPGVKVSTLFDDYKEQNKTNGLIFSGIYSSSGAVNNLNQFIQANKITKELNPTYGSLQKLHARDTDLIALCEDKVLKILANKDALFNADSSRQLIANENVLGQAVPFVGDYGISTNPESFVQEAYRTYFTDKQRGVVLRLSRDGLTPISLHGMKDYFRDNLKDADIILGSYDKKKDEYNLSYSTGTSDDFDDITDEINFFASPVNSWQRVFSAPDSFYPYPGTPGVQYEKLLIPANQEILNTNKYKVSFELIGQGGVLQGDLQVRLFNNATGVNEYYQVNEQTFPVFQDLTINDEGMYEYIVEPGSFTTTTGNYSGYENCLYLEGQFATADPSIPFIGTIKNPKIELVETIIAYTNENFKTITFKENVKGWPSHKSFVPESGVSCSGDYYTFNKGNLYLHHDENEPRNTFYGDYTNSSINLLLNDAPSISKSFVAINYEGSQSRIIENEDTSIDKSYYNLTEKPGWYLETLETEKEKGTISEFIEKEGKWFNYIKGIDEDLNLNSDFGSSNIQGLGTLKETPETTSVDDQGNVIVFDNLILKFNGKINNSLQLNDTIYLINNPSVNNTANDILKYEGKVLIIDRDNNTITVEQADVDGNIVFEADNYLMFAKQSVINNTGMLGQYAEVKFINNDTAKAELFAVSAEISQSSK
tara:strand:- start:4275 stop:6494 length:2220 start_codon:yes stop_codon:yes gene_type:complete